MTICSRAAKRLSKVSWPIPFCRVIKMVSGPMRALFLVSAASEALALTCTMTRSTGERPVVSAVAWGR